MKSSVEDIALFGRPLLSACNISWFVFTLIHGRDKTNSERTTKRRRRRRRRKRRRRRRGNLIGWFGFHLKGRPTKMLLFTCSVGGGNLGRAHRFTLTRESTRWCRLSQFANWCLSLVQSHAGATETLLVDPSQVGSCQLQRGAAFGHRTFGLERNFRRAKPRDFTAAQTSRLDRLGFDGGSRRFHCVSHRCLAPVVAVAVAVVVIAVVVVVAAAAGGHFRSCWRHGLRDSRARFQLMPVNNRLKKNQKKKEKN